MIKAQRGEALWLGAMRLPAWFLCVSVCVSVCMCVSGISCLVGTSGETGASLPPTLMAGAALGQYQQPSAGFLSLPSFRIRLAFHVKLHPPSWSLSKVILWFSHASFNRLSHFCQHWGREKKVLLMHWVPTGLQV